MARRKMSKSAAVQMCEGKSAFATWAQAARRVKSMARRDSSRRAQAYRCQFCKQYHIGNSAR
jgi:hypothetical protein